MSREIGIGLLGAGWMGELHSESYRRARAKYPEAAGRARLVIVADDSPGRAERARELHGYEAARPTGARCSRIPGSRP